MRISTRGKNAIKFMLDLGRYNHGESVKLKDIAKRQDISEKYLRHRRTAPIENLSRMVRRRYPKSESFLMTSEEEIAALEEWMNEYPREIFRYETAASRFNEEMMKLTG